MYNQSVRSVWTRPLDDSTQLGELTFLLGLYPHMHSTYYNASGGMQQSTFSQELYLSANLRKMDFTRVFSVLCHLQPAYSSVI